MGIELPLPHNERQFSQPHGGETVPPVATREIGQGRQNVENKSTEVPSFQEVRTGQGAGDGFTAQAPTSVTATTQDPLYDAPVNGISLDDVPVIAADEDLIEKQWVESVKRIVKETRTDPYRQGEAISRLQADYLLKRYGKTLGQASETA